MQFVDLSLATLSEGHAVADVDEALRRVLEDIDDPMKPPDKVRTITLKVTVIADGERRQLAYDHTVTTTLPGFVPRGGTAYMQHTTDGVKAVHVDPEQRTIAEAIAEVEAAEVEQGMTPVTRFSRAKGESS